MSIPQDQLTALSNMGSPVTAVAMAFLAAPPPSLRRVEVAQPAGCGYWRQAAEGDAFYTTAEDHLNCPIGAFTHGVPMSSEKSAELHGMLGTMFELKYIKSEEVPSIPHRTESFGVAAYAPLTRAAFAPDVVVFRGNVRQIMLLVEAATAAGAFGGGAVMGRPACAMLPHAIDSATAVASVGCIGNRVYTGLGDNEMYLTIPGRDVERVLSALDDTLKANTALEQFHRQRVGQSSSPIE
jgi:uncharacterized protein (DUF169 family)